MKYRSIVGSLLQAPWACGYAFLALVAYLSKSWYTIQVLHSPFPHACVVMKFRLNVCKKLQIIYWFQIITVLLHTGAMVLIHFLPESPRWLIVMNRVKEAEGIIRRACHLNKTSLPSDLGLVRFLIHKLSSYRINQRIVLNNFNFIKCKDESNIYLNVNCWGEILILRISWNRTKVQSLSSLVRQLGGYLFVSIFLRGSRVPNKKFH